MVNVPIRSRWGLKRIRLADQAAAVLREAIKNGDLSDWKETGSAGVGSGGVYAHALMVSKLGASAASCKKVNGWARWRGIN